MDGESITVRAELQKFKYKYLKSLCNKLKCSRCGKFLSVLPIYHCSSVGSICGRCTKDLEEMISTGWLQPATTYELLAKHLEFPCSNKHAGCSDWMKWNAVVEHENECLGKLSRRDLYCPLSNCRQPTHKTNLELMDHFLNCHKVEYRENPVRLTALVSDASRAFFTKVFNRVFFVRITTQSVQEGRFGLCCFVGVVCVNADHGYESKFYQFKVECVDASGNKVAVQWSEATGHILKYGRCTGSGMLYMGGIKTDFVVETLCNNGDDLKICIVRQDDDDIAEIERNENMITLSEKQKVANVINTFKSGKLEQLAADATVPLQCAEITTETKLLKELECLVCANYMYAPIFICSAGHSICNDCKEKINACPTCRAPIGNARNYTLEGLADQLKYPCKFEKLGCQERPNGTDMKQHVLNCIYNTVKCPFANCDILIRLANVASHILDNHTGSIFTPGDMLKKHVSAKHPPCEDTIILKNDVFVLRFEHEDKSFPLVKFDCLYIVLHGAKNKYAFELQFKDQTNRNLRFDFRRLCKSNLAEFGNDPVVLPIELLKSFIGNGPVSSLYFQCFIYKV